MALANTHDTCSPQVLANTKAKATEVNAKLIAAAETRVSINEKREQYRPVATRGSVLYFCIVDMSLVNVMYQTSLDQFQVLFLASMDTAEKAALASKRVGLVVEEMTYNIWRYIDRGLYTRDRSSFKLMLLLKILQTSGRLSAGLVTQFLKAGAALNILDEKPKPYAWMSDGAWLNVIQLSNEGGVYKSIVESITREEEDWKNWYNANEPEQMTVPGYETQLNADKELGPFLRLLVVRCLREDRALLAGMEFIKTMATVDGIPAMGERFIKPVSDTVEQIYNEMTALVPVIYLLSAGADPTESVEMLAKKKRRNFEARFLLFFLLLFVFFFFDDDREHFGDGERGGAGSDDDAGGDGHLHLLLFLHLPHHLLRCHHVRGGNRIERDEDEEDDEEQREE